MNNPYQTGQNQRNANQQNNAQNQQSAGQSGGQDWTKNPSLSGIDAEKLKMLNSIASQGSQKGMNELLPFLMSAVSQNESKSESGGMHFTPKEMDTIIEVLKMGKSPQETAKIERMMQIIRMMR